MIVFTLYCSGCLMVELEQVAFFYRITNEVICDWQLIGDGNGIGAQLNSITIDYGSLYKMFQRSNCGL